MLPKPMVFRVLLRTLVCTACIVFSAVAQQSPTPQNQAPSVPVPNRITQAIDESNVTTLKGNTHPLARAEFDRGPAPANLPLNRMLLVLSRSSDQEAGLEALLDQQQDKSTQNYHAWLTPEQFGQQFGPSDQDIQTITSWLQTHGFTVSRISKGRTAIEFSGNAAQLRQAFHTEIHKYTVKGEDHWANSSDPQIPSALSPVVAGLQSLNNFRRRPMLHVDGAFSRSKDTGKITPLKPLLTISDGGCGVSGNCYGVGPYDFANIYNVLPLWTPSSGTAIDGTGQTIAIVGETDIDPQDVSAFRAFFGMPAPNLNVIHDGADPGILTDGEETEADLDVEWSGAIAKGATIDFVVSASTETTHGVDLSAEYIIDNNLAPAMSESYGECELGIGTTGNEFFKQLWQQAAAQGITVFISAGDNGAAGCDDFDATERPAPSEFGLQVSGYASTPYNVAVGGTDFNDAMNPAQYWNPTNAATTQESAKGYIPETTWNDTCTNGIFASLGFSSNAETNCNNSQLVNFVSTIGGSGGKSACTTSSGQTPSSCSGGYSKPSWQTGTGVPPDGKRDIPDVSLYAASGSPSGSFYIVCEADALQGASSCDPTNPYTEFLGVGGTSASSPAFAGIMGLINQKTSSRQGNANYVFYKIPAQSGASCNSTNVTSSTNSCIFYDTTNGTIAMPCASGSNPTCVTNPAGESFGILTGYVTTSGYDQATGLGSVNVNNLVTQWNNFAGQFKGTRTTLTLTPPGTPTHGQPWAVAAAVTPQTGTGTPTGTITLIATTSSGQDAVPQVFQLSGGSLPAGTTTTLLPGGNNYQVTAHYSGDNTYAASDSSAVTVTVHPESSKTQLSIVTFSPTTGQVTSSNATTFAYGSPYILRADVMNSSGTSCFNSTSQTLSYACPSGTVALTDNGSALGSGSYGLNAQGYTEYQAIQLTGGAHTLAGNYSGDSSYNSSSGSDAVTVTLAPTTTSASTNQGQAFIGSPYLINVITQSNSLGASPTANYVVYDGSTQLPTTVSNPYTVTPQAGVVELDATLQITLSAPSGNHVLTVHYNGDTNYASSVSAPLTVATVYSTTISETVNPTTVVYPGSITITASIDTGNPAGNSALKPTGTFTIQVYVEDAQISPVTTTTTQDSHGNWVLQGTATFTPQQSDFIQVNYSGDSNYGPSNASAYVTVTVPGFTVSSNPSSITITAGQTGTATLTITPSTNYTSTVALSCQGFVLSSETCSVSPSSVTLSNGAAATATLSVSTAAPSSSTTATIVRVRKRGAFPLAVDRDVWFGSGTVAGVVALFLLALPSTRRKWQSLRWATWFATACVLCLLIACGGGSNSGGGGGGGGEGGDTGPFPTTTGLSASSTKIAAGSSATLTATVSGTDTITGAVNFDVDGMNTFNTVNLTNDSAQATINNPFPYGVGTFIVAAHYNGDANNLASESGSLNIVVTGSAVQDVVGQTATLTQGVNVTLTVQ